MNLVQLLLGFDGRISRQPFWIGVLIVTAIELSLLLTFGIPFFPEQPKPISIRAVEFAIELVSIYPTTAVVVKRLHDRDQPGYYAAWLVSISLLIATTNLLGYTDNPKNTTWLDWVLGMAAVVITLAFLIELGFRRGTAGENRYGPDPLGGSPAGGRDRT
jgi:uncharacterized membrane protein YhaH (DUF805 family)